MEILYKYERVWTTVDGRGNAVTSKIPYGYSGRISRSGGNGGNRRVKDTTAESCALWHWPFTDVTAATVTVATVATTRVAATKYRQCRRPPPRGRLNLASFSRYRMGIAPAVWSPATMIHPQGIVEILIIFQII